MTSLHAAEPIRRLEENVARVIRGKREVIRLATVCLLARGHVLLEDVPGVGKTTLAQALARSLGLSFQRIQFTSDLLPSDIIGVSIFNQKTQTFEFVPGPLFANVVLADEINRATPKTQSALLEAMSERKVSVERKRFSLPEPFVVLATQNPLEYQGTFPLPESQLDRFLMSLSLGYPPRADEQDLLLSGGVEDLLEELQPVLSQRGCWSSRRGWRGCASPTSWRTTCCRSPRPPATAATSCSGSRPAACSRCSGPPRRSPSARGAATSFRTTCSAWPPPCWPTASS